MSEDESDRPSRRVSKNETLRYQLQEGERSDRIERVLNRIGRMEARMNEIGSTDCMLDGAPTNCQVAFRAVAAGIAIPEGFLGGELIGCSQGICTFQVPTRIDFEMQTVLEYSLVSVNFGFLADRGVGAFDSALRALGKFFRGRRKGQSFGGCLQENINLTTFGLYKDSAELLKTGVALLAVTAAKSPIKGVALSEYATLYAGALLKANILPQIPDAVIETAAIGAGQAAAVGGGAALGVFIGSLGGCISEGVTQ